MQLLLLNVFGLIIFGGLWPFVAIFAIPMILAGVDNR
jgi:hypothetical protein